MRQVGFLCAAAYVAVRDTVGKLADDHRKAKALAGFKNLVVFSFFLLSPTSLHFCCAQFTNTEHPLCFETPSLIHAYPRFPIVYNLFSLFY
jgi:hypothetical protein